MSAFNTLQAAYHHRLAAARAARTAGQQVVGYVGNTVPVELIAAAGCHPVRVAPVAGDAARADSHIENFSDLDVRLIYAMYLAGELACLDLLVIPRSTESQHKLYLSLREAWRTGLVTAGPELWLYDILHTQRDSSRTYGLARTRDLQRRLAALAGVEVTAAALQQAITLGNSTRLLLQELQGRRLARAISGHQAQVATGALRFMAPRQGHDMLQAWLAEDQHVPCAGPRLLVKGCPLDHDALHALVEQAGARLVLEDDDWGSRAAAPLVATDKPALEALFDHVWRDVPCPRLHPAPEAGAWFAQALQQRAFDAVLFNLPRPDDIHGWSFPAERSLAQQAGLPWLLLRDDARRHPAALLAQLRTFIATLPT